MTASTCEQMERYLNVTKRISLCWDIIGNNSDNAKDKCTDQPNI